MYTFRILAGMFIRLLVIQRGIEANLIQIKSLLDMASPHTKNDTMKLNSIIAALS